MSDIKKLAGTLAFFAQIGQIGAQGIGRPSRPATGAVKQVKAKKGCTPCGFKKEAVRLLRKSGAGG